MANMTAAVFVEPGRIEQDNKPIPDVGPLDALMRVLVLAPWVGTQPQPTQRPDRDHPAARRRLPDRSGHAPHALRASTTATSKGTT